MAWLQGPKKRSSLSARKQPVRARGRAGTRLGRGLEVTLRRKPPGPAPHLFCCRTEACGRRPRTPSVRLPHVCTLSSPTPTRTHLACPHAHCHTPCLPRHVRSAELGCAVLPRVRVAGHVRPGRRPEPSEAPLLVWSRVSPVRDAHTAGKVKGVRTRWLPFCGPGAPCCSPSPYSCLPGSQIPHPDSVPGTPRRKAALAPGPQGRHVLFLLPSCFSPSIGS